MEADISLDFLGGLETSIHKLLEASVKGQSRSSTEVDYNKLTKVKYMSVLVQVLCAAFMICRLHHTMLHSGIVSKTIFVYY